MGDYNAQRANRRAEDVLAKNFPDIEENKAEVKESFEETVYTQAQTAARSPSVSSFCDEWAQVSYAAVAPLVSLCIATRYIRYVRSAL